MLFVITQTFQMKGLLNGQYLFEGNIPFTLATGN